MAKKNGKSKAVMVSTGGDIATYTPPTNVIMEEDNAEQVRVGDMLTVEIVGKVTGVRLIEGQRGAKKFDVTFENVEVSAIKGNSADRALNELIFDKESDEK